MNRISDKEKITDFLEHQRLEGIRRLISTLTDRESVSTGMYYDYVRRIHDCRVDERYKSVVLAELDEAYDVRW